MMFIIAFMLINDPEDAGKIDSKAEMLITVRWADGHPDDVDALVEGPHGEVVWYHNRDGELMHLRFRLDSAGEVVGTNELQKRLLTLVLDKS